MTGSSSDDNRMFVFFGEGSWPCHLLLKKFPSESNVRNYIVCHLYLCVPEQFQRKTVQRYKSRLRFSTEFLIDFQLLRLPALNNEFLIPLIIRYREFIRTATDLAIFNIFLIVTLRGIHKSVIYFTTVSTSKFCSLRFPFKFHGLMN